MADNKLDQPNLPTPEKVEQEREKKTRQGLGFDDILRYMSLGISPTAPRLPEQANMTGQYFGGYPKGYTNRLGAKGTISFHILRQVSERSPMLAAILSTRQHQMKRYHRIVRRSKKGEVGLRVVHRRQADPKFKVPEAFTMLCREVEEMIEKPWKVYWQQGSVYENIEPTFASLGSKITEDILIINRPVIELGLDPLRIPRAFGAIDGANVIPTFAAIRYLTSLNRDIPKDWEANWNSYRRTLQFISERYKVDLDERTEYIYILAGRPVVGFRHDELLISPMFPTTEVRSAGYPKSLMERAIFIILAEIMVMTANARYFEFGSMAEILLAMKGSYTDQHIKDIEQIFQGNLSGVNGMFRMPLIALPGGANDIQKIDLKQNHKDMLFDVYIQKLTNLACAVFRMHPSEINEAPRAGDNSGSLNQASQNKQINMSQEQGLETLLLHEKTEILDPIVQRIDPDLCVEWDMGQSEAETLQLTTQYAPITTVNERRAMMDLDPISDEEGGNVIDNQYIQARNQQDQAAEQQQQNMEMQQQQHAAEMQARETEAAQPGGGAEGQPGKPSQGKPKPKVKPKQAGKKNVRPKNESEEDRINRVASLQG